MDRLELRDINDLTRAGALRGNIAGQGRPQTKQGRNIVGRPGIGPHRWLWVGKAGLVHESAKSLTYHVVRGPTQVVLMACLTVAGDMRNDELGVGLEHDIISESPLGIGAGL